MRLNKYLAHSGIASRRKADDMIRSGRVCVNGEQITSLGEQVGDDDSVTVDGKVVFEPEEEVVYALNKPSGVISAVTDTHGRKTVVDLIADRRRLYPVGRLDRDTTGILLITNAGELANRLTHPRYGVPREYLALVDGRLPQGAIAELKRGLFLAPRVKVSANLTPAEKQGRNFLYRVTLYEGKNREIKRIFSHFGLRVKRLHRSSFAGFTADNLPPGDYRKLRKGEILLLWKRVAKEGVIAAV